ncbi:hypothetical protein SEUCBS139899_007182 [Sporothrix eucalyptigena]|uniref:Transcriptional activator n=1 Tax=Sporothrix eucalyptigena TaxID=1812306 RepID=A0ABP0C3P0_9PEZI
MSQNGTGRAGVVKGPSDGNGMDQLASAILDDLLYNVIHDLIMKTHRDEKQARAATAAIRVETLAAEAAQDLAGATGESKPEGKHETEAALYEAGEVTLKKNPLQTTTDILCPRCHLPRLLHPTDGRGAHKPDPNVTYCKKHPYIDKPGCDIYGQMWVAPGPGRGKKKKDFDKKVSAAIHAATTGIEGTDEKGAANGTTEQRPPNVLSFPSATCSKCKRCILVSRLNNHMGSCIGNSGRNASRAAAAKISNGSGRDSAMADHTPPNSQKGTPLPSSQGSPRKRDADDFDDDGYEDTEMTGVGGSQGTAKPKKKLKSSASASAATSQAGGSVVGTPSSSQGLSNALNKKLTLKMKNTSGSASPAAAAGSIKKQKAKPSSALSFERKINDNYDDDDEEEADDDGDRENNDGDYVDEDSPYKQRPRGNRMDDDDDDDEDGVRNSINFKPGSKNGVHNGSSTGANGANGANGKLKKTKKLLGTPSAASATPSPPKKTTKVPIPPIPGNKKVKLVSSNSVNSLNNKATPLSPPASKNGSGNRMRDIDAGSESSGTMSSPRG